MNDRYRPARIAAGAAIIGAALSISLTQIAMALCVLLAAVACLRNRRGFTTPVFNIKSFYANLSGPVWLAGGLLFAWLATAYGAHRYGPHRSLPGSAPGELFDVVHFGFGLLVFGLIRAAPPGDRILKTSLEIFCWVLLLSGLVACFSEFRLARLVMGHGFEASAANRPQHDLALPFGIRLFRPVGFMNTRLTYAGLLVLVLPLLWGHFSRSMGPFRAAQILVCLFLLAVNGTRSAWLGAMLASGFIFAFSLKFFRLWEMRSLRFGLVAAGLIVLSAAFLFPRGDLERQTDFQRSVIWVGAAELIRAHPLLGTGPGNFRERTLEWRAEFLEEHPQTLYWIHLTPAGHAHNDFLHLSAVGGLPAGFLFLCLAAACMLAARRLTAAGENQEPWRFVFLGMAGFFGAGLFQCYFQDDEVVIVFWILIACAAGFAGRRLTGSENERPYTGPADQLVER